MAGPVKASTVRSERVDWLWEERIPRRMISVVAGRPDQAKGLFAIAVGADVTKQGGNVLHSAIEDSRSIMTKPRYQAAGADLDRVNLWRFSLPAQLKELEAHITEESIDLLVIDPFAAHLGQGVSRHSDNIRSVLTPLSEMLEVTNTACIIIEHALKRVPAHGEPLNAIGGTGSGLPAAARMAFVFGVDPTDDDNRMLCCVKANIREKPKAVQFRLDTTELRRIGAVPYLVFDDEVEFDAMRLFDGRYKHGHQVGRPSDKRKQAAEWFVAYMVAAGKPVRVKQIREDAKQYGMSERTLQRAADDMKVVRIPPGGGPNVHWDLSDALKKRLAEDDDEIEAQAQALAKGVDPDRTESTDLDDFLSQVLEEDEKRSQAEGDDDSAQED